MRGTTREEGNRAPIEATGAECHVGDPDRIGTLTYALDNATVLCWLMGSASGDAEDVAALHGSRLEMLLERTIDTTVRGMVYEAAGSVDAGVLEAGGARVARACGYSEIPFRLVDADPSDHEAWLAAMLSAIRGLLHTDELP